MEICATQVRDFIILVVFTSNCVDWLQTTLQLLPVNFSFLAQFGLKKARFSSVFPTYVQFCNQIVVVLFLTYSTYFSKFSSECVPTCLYAALQNLPLLSESDQVQQSIMIVIANKQRHSFD